MNICVINNLYPPLARGGAEQVVEKTVAGLLDAGHSVVLITLGKGGTDVATPPNLPLKRGGTCVNTYVYHPWNLFFYTDAHKHGFLARFVWHLVDMFHVGSARFVREVLEKEQSDVVHTHNLMGLGFLIPRVIRSLRIRHVHTVHDVQLVEPSGIILKQKEHAFRYNGLPTRVYAGLMRRLMGSPDVVISPSNFLLEFYRRWKFFPQSQFVQLRNPMTFSLINNKQLTINNANAFHFYYIGQVEEHKGVLFLLKTILNFSTEKDCELHIVGDGSILEDVKKKAEKDERVIIHGRVSREKLPDIFADADMVIVPSLCYENSPTVIFESFAFGVPVLASHIEGIAELIEEGKQGITFRAGDEKELSEKLSWCLDHAEDVADMGMHTGTFLKAMSSQEYVPTLLSLYEEKKK
ncbi:MAG: hypothetical protein CO030_03500 [Candidatus Magasanikbacteria bacterium CG_4_9_14_0_2_um_filter_42_11]|uniref:Glycosyltransferase subfamily 4-like N-terminal domain-containing protein n=1 Tax=Candidatus Magasanikbacteria bacterium CG_4_9_14_0_2_um_filter_42_11 TaxID=1974643 RepID=A0A2M8F9A2_9BACT|nr:MAG: hypothetical protein COU34_02800 [Candidatus Magasanikbacteria bacterium CG10_big_fil_rev_8_21_14_0_10_43_9]PIY92890.1 MAG: hypothetical protein COY70_00900 [Candidatus Magasanikbacteria bacterium CG_4_10_14_0_8_um_filter_42_12]PJC52325.1 MAG: hypothetical protein CO030_03500 [Candidatus Magasanikbacteria bacterium CG_4_9_14_0_2_um_filter_42_11]